MDGVAPAPADATKVMHGDVTGRWMRRHLTGISSAGLAAVVALALCAGAGAAKSSAQPCGAAKAGSGDIDGASGGPGSDSFPGGAARDSLDGGGGADCLSGGAGPDFLGGGAGDDKLLGGPGEDQVIAGPGRDRVSAGQGKDLILARDGVAETVSCGRGRDRVSADRPDALRGCEHVSYVPGDVLWQQVGMHFNAYGYAAVRYNNDGYCKGDADAATCKGSSEEGNFPFSAGREIRMEWEPSAYGGSEIVTIRAPQTDSILIGRADAHWAGPSLQITAAWVGQWVDPNHGIVRTGVGGAPGTKGGPLRADLSYHSFPDYLFNIPRHSGYSLDLRGWIKILIVS